MVMAEGLYLSFAPVLVAVAASMDLTAAVISQCALCIRERSIDVKDFDASLTCNIAASNISGDGVAAIAGHKVVQKVSNFNSRY